MSTNIQSFSAFIEQERQSNAYKSYLHARERILAMLTIAQDGTALPSTYWQQEVAGFEYLLDASPLITNKIREHCYHISGLRSYEYRSHHAHQAKPFANKLKALSQIDTDNLFVPESPQLGGFGHHIEGNLVNLDTLKFYESLIALNKGGLLQDIRTNSGDKKVVVEIGGGWGGFGYQFKTICPNTCYVMIDLPQSLLFSSVYLMTLFPNARSFIYGDQPVSHLVDNLGSYDLVFLPHYFIDSHTLPHVELGINMISFQEMTEGQIMGYVKWLWEANCPAIYSHNRGKSPHNTEITTSVPDIIGRGYATEEISVLPVPYTVLDLPKKEQREQVEWQDDPHIMAKYVMKRVITPVKKEAGVSLTDYRHVMGKRNQSFISPASFADEVIS